MRFTAQESSLVRGTAEATKTDKLYVIFFSFLELELVHCVRQIYVVQ
jgi:hypothetical protein